MIINLFFILVDLQKIEQKITAQDYVKLSEFIGDMTKIFDNCRFYNSKESSFYRCAESLEGYFVQRIKHLRETLAATADKTTLPTAVVETKATGQTASAEKDAAVDVPMEEDGEGADEEMDEEMEMKKSTESTTTETATTTTTATTAKT